jgi:phosphate/sulfate permease
MFGLDITLFILLFLCLFLACAFEFVNGFHDTANAVATVIYTNSLKPTQAVVWSGFVNFIGLLTGGVGLTMSIIGLLPTELLIDPNVYHAMALSFAMLGTAIAWNLATWYFGIPASSSHTLIGSIIGIGVGYALLPENNKGLSTVNWDKAIEIGQALLLSPLFGFAVAIVLMYILKKSSISKDIFKEPKKDTPPPLWIRAILIFTCSMVSLFHGRNDGQKGIGLVMLVLIAFLPSFFAIDTRVDPFKLQSEVAVVNSIVTKIDTNKLSSTEKESYDKIMKGVNSLNLIYSNKSLNAQNLSVETKLEIRKDVLNISKHTKKLMESEAVTLSTDDKKSLTKATAGDKPPFFSFGNTNKGLSSLTDFAPPWVMWMIALSLGLGTMIGWKRIVVTVGEKIGKQHLSYAQGASAEIVASITIGLATAYKWPVSTTHVLSSGIAGSMVASKGIKNLQGGTVKNIVMAWVLTLPVTILVSATLFYLLRTILG